MQVEKLPPNLNDLKSQFMELRKEYVRLINSGVSADEASKPETIFARFLEPQPKAPLLDLATQGSGQAVRKFDTAERSSHRRVARADIDSQESYQEGRVARPQRAPQSQIKPLPSGVQGQTNTKGRDTLGLDLQYSAGRASGNTGSGRFTEPRKTEEESHKKLDPRQALFASASASVNESGNKQPRQLTGRRNQAVAIDEDYNDDPDGLFEYQTDVKAKVASKRGRTYDLDMAVDLDGEIDEGAEEMYIDGYEEHDLDQLIEDDEERAVAYRVSQDEIDDYIGSEKQSKANVVESDFRDQGSRDLRNSRGNGQTSLRNSSAASQAINDPIYLQLRSELDAIKKKINSLEGEHQELRNINSQLMTRSGGDRVGSQGSLPIHESQKSAQQDANFVQDRYRRSDLQDSTDQQIEQELQEIKNLIKSSLSNQSGHQTQSQVHRELGNGSVAQNLIPRHIHDAPAQQTINPSDPSYKAFYFNSAFSLGAPTAYLSPGDPLADNASSALSPGHPNPAPAEAHTATAPPHPQPSRPPYPPNPYLQPTSLLQPVPAAALQPGAASLPPLPPPPPAAGASLSSPLQPKQQQQQQQQQQHTGAAGLSQGPGQTGPFAAGVGRPGLGALRDAVEGRASGGASLLSSQSAGEASSSSTSGRHIGGGLRRSGDRARLAARGLDASGLALYHKWSDVVRGEWSAIQTEEQRISAETRLVKNRKKGIREMEWEVLHVLGDRKSSIGDASDHLQGPVSRITESAIEGLRYAVFLYELDTEKLYLLNDILRSRSKKLKDIEKSLKIALKSGRIDAMTDDYLTLVFYQYMELCNLYEFKWKIDTSKLVPYRKYNKSLMSKDEPYRTTNNSKFYKTEFLEGSHSSDGISESRKGKVFDESLSHFDFLKESLHKLKDGTLLPGEAVRIYSDIDMFFENQHIWFSQIKKDIKVVMKRLSNPTNSSALRNA